MSVEIKGGVKYIRKELMRCSVKGCEDFGYRMRIGYLNVVENRLYCSHHYLRYKGEHNEDWDVIFLDRTDFKKLEEEAREDAPRQPLITYFICQNCGKKGAVIPLVDRSLMRDRRVLCEACYVQFNPFYCHICQGKLKGEETLWKYCLKCDYDVQMLRKKNDKYKEINNSLTQWVYRMDWGDKGEQMVNNMFVSQFPKDYGVDECKLVEERNARG